MRAGAVLLLALGIGGRAQSLALPEQCALVCLIRRNLRIVFQLIAFQGLREQEHKWMRR